MATRMKDIAAEFGVSVVTVSSVLRKRGRVSPELRARILKRAEELDYRPDLTARSLATGRTLLIGMIVPDLMHPFFAAIAKFMARYLREEGYSLVISSSEDDPKLELEEVETFLTRRVDALVLASSQQTKTSEVFRRIAAMRVPYVLLDRPVPGLSAPFVGSDNEAIGELATRHLIERGYRRIAYIGAHGLGSGGGRLKGYKKMLRSAGRLVAEELIQMVASADERGEQCGYAAMQQFLGMTTRPDAAFCLNDILASGAMKAVVDAGLSVPGDMAILGVSNLSGLSFWNSFQVPISSVDQDVEAIAAHASRVTLQLLAGKEKECPQVSYLPLRLVARSST